MTASSAAAAPVDPPLRFAAPPDVRFAPATGGGAWFVASARFTRSLPVRSATIRASLVVAGTSTDVPGIQRIPGPRPCYGQETYWDERRPVPRDGDVVTVRLDVSGRRQPLTAQAPARQVSFEELHGDAGLRERLGCPPAPEERRCNGFVRARFMSGISVHAAAGGATCATARRVMRAVGRWAHSGRCFLDLCVRRHRMNAGFRCSVIKDGEADWAITCRRGRAVVRGSTAE